MAKKETTSGNVPERGEEYPTPTDKKKKNGQYEDYWVLSEEERQKGFVRPVRKSYKHKECGSVTTMSRKLAETYARDPKFYGSTFCCHCKGHFPVKEFIWEGTDIIVGT